jgi:hypothetical protein
MTKCPTETTSGRKDYFGSLFQRVQSMVAWFCVSGPVVKENNMVAKEHVTSWQQEAEKRE